MPENNFNNQESVSQSQNEAKPFNPNDSERIAQLEAKFESKEISQEALATARDINEFSSYLSQLTSFNDSMVGSISAERILSNIREINTDLGQAVGLIRQYGSVGDSSQAIIDKVYADISKLPSDIQKMYRPLVVKYLNESRAELVKN